MKQRKGKGNKKFSSYFNSCDTKDKLTLPNNKNTITRFRCGSEDHWIIDCQKPENLQNRVHWNMENPKSCAFKSTKVDKASDKSI